MIASGNHDFSSKLFLKPAFLCEPSQNGLFADCPHRQSQVSSPSNAISRPPSVRILNFL